MARFTCSVPVLREHSWRIVESDELIPGDVIDVSDLHLLPCDALLVDGDCIVNESMLTGESIPISKTTATDFAVRKLDISAHDLPVDVSKHVLFCGTKIVRARPGEYEWIENDIDRTVATVIRTGFNTTKGSLVRSMLFPRPNKFKFYRDSFYFIGVLAMIAIIGFLASVVKFIHLGVPVWLMVVRALDLITIVVPPALPATMTVGMSFALARLREKRIFCTSPPRINVSGKINCVCFDKTGTLTEEGLDVLGVRQMDMGTTLFQDLVKSAELINSEPTEQSLIQAMATCHSLKHVHGELVGDPLDLKMFEFTGWVLTE